MPQLSGQASGHKSGTTLCSLDQVGIELFRYAAVRGNSNDPQIGVQLEFESLQAKGQSLPDGF